ncbi:MAG: lysophospholipid acyltransferase family protein [Deltaproteobacteria bacterium]|nr:lysophospholipid acyltransferase family protein [Deltaproteobacteria bacterium]
MPWPPDHQSTTSPKDKRLSRFLQSPLITLFFGHLPPSLSRHYLGLFGLAYFRFAADERKTIQRALNFCLRDGLTPGEARRRWTRTRRGIIDHYYEKLFLAFPAAERVRRSLERQVEVSGLKILDQALTAGRGVILVTGHYGAVEFIPAVLSLKGYPVTAMVHCNTKTLRKILDERSALVGINILDPKSESVFFSVIKNLQQGRILVTQCDEINMWRPYRNKKVKFLGLEVGLDRSLDIMARKSKAPVLFGLNHRRSRRRYELVIEQPAQHPAAQALELTSAQCLAILETHIYMHPEAWYEWKKLKPFVERTISEVSNENLQRLRLSNQMAFHSAG